MINYKKMISVISAVLITYNLTVFDTYAFPNYYDDSPPSETITAEPEIKYSTLVINSFDNASLKSMNIDISYEVKNTATNEKIYFNVSNSAYMADEYGSYSEIDGKGIVYLTLPLGDYEIVPKNPSGYNSTKSSQKISINEANNIYQLDFYYQKNTEKLKINIKNENGTVPSGYSIQMTNTSGNDICFTQVGDKYSYISGSNGVRRINTDDEGNILLNDLPVGVYNIFLINPSNEIEDDKTQTVDLNEKNEINISLTAKNGNINLSVVDKNLKLLKGTSYTITNSAGTPLNFNKNSDISYSYSTSGTTSIISFVLSEPIMITDLPAGTYTLTETNSLTGYIPAQPQQIEVKSDETIDVQVDQTTSSGVLVINVTEEMTEDPVEGCSYSIYNKETDTLYKMSQLPNGNYSYSENGDLTAVTSNSNGVITVEGLPATDIVIRGKDTPLGYIVDKVDVQKTIAVNNTTLCDMLVSKSNLAITILDKNSKGIVGVKVSIYKVGNENDEQLVLNGTTNANGKILLTNISPGNYTYMIASVPEGFFWDKTVYSFSIDDGGLTSDLTPITLEDVKIQVKIGPSNGESLANGRFAIEDESGNTISNASTNEDGVATFYNIGYGTYTIKQVSAPIGYACSDKEIKVTIDENYSSTDPISFEDDVPETTNVNEINQNDNQDSTDKKDSKVDIGTILIAVLCSVALLVLLIVGAIVINIIKSKKDDDIDDDDEEEEEEDDEEELPKNKSNKDRKIDEDINKKKTKIYMPPQKSQVHQPQNTNLNINLSDLSEEQIRELKDLLNKKE